jgi:hypothetical protein
MSSQVISRLVVAGVLSSMLPTAAIAEADDKALVLATVQTLLDGWRGADATKLETALHPDFREVTLHLMDSKWDFAAVDRQTLIGLMAKIDAGSWDDQLVDPLVLVDGPIAVVWSHYRFTVRYTEDGVAHAPVHCGIETFQLYRIDGTWKIVNFADTHSDLCP